MLQERLHALFEVFRRALQSIYFDGVLDLLVQPPPRVLGQQPLDRLHRLGAVLQQRLGQLEELATHHKRKGSRDGNIYFTFTMMGKDLILPLFEVDFSGEDTGFHGVGEFRRLHS